MEELIKSIGSKILISSDLKEAISVEFKCVELPKNKRLVEENQYCRKLFFLEKGTVRTFYHHNENDITSWFYSEGYFFSSWYSFYAQQPSFENIETLETSVIYELSHTSYQKLVNEFPKFERFARLLAEEQTAFIDLYSKGYMFLTAKEKYEQLLSFFPDIELRTKLGHIASFLGISQETLSRIRAGK